MSWFTPQVAMIAGASLGLPTGAAGEHLGRQFPAVFPGASARSSMLDTDLLGLVPELTQAVAYHTLALIFLPFHLPFPTSEKICKNAAIPPVRFY